MDNQNPGFTPQIIRPDPLPQAATSVAPEQVTPQAPVSLPEPVASTTPESVAAPAAAPALASTPALNPVPLPQQLTPPPPPPVAEAAPPVAAPTTTYGTQGEQPTPGRAPFPAAEAFNTEPEVVDEHLQIQDPQFHEQINNDADGPEIYWQAPEFIDHYKGTQWYVAFAGAALAVIFVGFLISRDITTVIVLAIISAMFGFMAARKPRVVDLGLGDQGIYVGDRFYPYHDFNAFTITHEGKVFGIDFMPLKRFSPMLSIYCDSAHEGEIQEFLAHFLPLSHRKRSLIDGFMQRIHF